MAKKKSKPSTDIKVTVAEGVNVTVADNRKRRGSIYQQLKISRRILNPDMVTFAHPDVMRICESYDINIRQFKSLSRDEKSTVLGILEGVKSYHMDLAEECDRHAGFITRFDDIFDPSAKKEVKFRKDIQKLVDAKNVDLDSYMEDWFADPDEVEAYEPTPYVRNRLTPAEQRLPMIDAFATEVCPTFNTMVDEQLMGNAPEMPLLGGESGTDEAGFQPK